MADFFGRLSSIPDQDVILEDHLKITVLTTDSVPMLGGISDYIHGLMSVSYTHLRAHET